ncbi:MAG: hypothetical protein AABX29_03485 [Nanoarchaeota archaeon]
MNRVKIAIFFSLVVLIGLIVISMFLAQSGGKNNLTKDVIKPVIEETKTDPSKLLSETKNLPYLTGEDADKNFQLQDKMPYVSQDFELGYSDLTGKYYLYKKSPKADAQLKKFLENNSITNLNNLIYEVNKNVQNVITLDENKIIDYNLTELKKSDSKYLDKIKQDIRLLSEVVKIFSEPIEPKQEISSSQSAILKEDLNLDKIFNEAGSKVGTPPKILKGVMTRECPPIISLPNEKIIEYSNPGNGIPIGHGCYRNSIGASGPMQFLPDVWTGYAFAVNRFGGYTHTPYIANIRDSVYGAAWKLKRDSRSTDLNWTYDQVRRAIICYNAGCGRLSNPPSSTLRYLEAVWNIYNST